MKPKYIIFFMQFFTSICLVSVGFASWTFVSGDSITASGNIVAQDVHMYVRPYEDNETEGPDHFEVFRYHETGFVTGEGINTEITNVGTLTYKYTIDLSECKSALTSALANNGSTNSFNIQFTLSHSIIDSFTLIDDYLSSCTYTESNDYTVNQNRTQDNTHVLNINFFELVNSYVEGNDNSFYFEITYTFTYSPSNTSSFKDDVYDCLIEDEFEFISKVNVEVK